MANAIANMLGKRILLINYPSLSSRDSEILIKYIFREAKLTDSVNSSLLLFSLYLSTFLLSILGLMSSFRFCFSMNARTFSNREIVQTPL